MFAIAMLSLGTGVGQAVLVWFPTLAIARLGVSGSETTPLMAPLAVGGIAATVLITALMDRTGARPLLVAGALTTLAGVLLASALPPSRVAFMAGAGLLGVGITGLSGGPLRYAAAHAVKAEGQGLAQSAVALVTNVGLLGASMLLGWLVGGRADERAAIEFALLLSAAAMAVLFLTVGLLPGRHAAPVAKSLEETR
jgi:MFS family permease